MLPRLRAIFLLGFWFSAVAIIAPVLIALCRITGNENTIYTPVRWFMRLGLWAVGIKVEVSGADRIDPARTYIFSPNHQSLIEVPLMIAFLKRNLAYLAKKELFKYPIWGYGIRLIGCIPVDRSNSPAAVESARMATERIRNGKSYAVYPEGTRSPDGRLLPFKKGAFLMAVDAGVPIVPVSISGSAAIMPKGQIKIYPSTIRMTVHDPINTAGYNKENISELMAITRAKILSGLSEENGEVTATPTGGGQEQSS
jgi:1-acyl-sn-glycerol-3-phosphate acyltransferase